LDYKSRFRSTPRRLLWFFVYFRRRKRAENLAGIRVLREMEKKENN